MALIAQQRIESLARASLIGTEEARWRNGASYQHGDTGRKTVRTLAWRID